VLAATGGLFVLVLVLVVVVVVVVVVIVVVVVVVVVVVDEDRREDRAEVHRKRGWVRLVAAVAALPVVVCLRVERLRGERRGGWERRVVQVREPIALWEEDPNRVAANCSVVTVVVVVVVIVVVGCVDRRVNWVEMHLRRRWVGPQCPWRASVERTRLAVSLLAAND